MTMRGAVAHKRTCWFLYGCCMARSLSAFALRIEGTYAQYASAIRRERHKRMQACRSGVICHQRSDGLLVCGELHSSVALGQPGYSSQHDAPRSSVQRQMSGDQSNDLCYLRLWRRVACRVPGHIRGDGSRLPTRRLLFQLLLGGVPLPCSTPEAALQAHRDPPADEAVPVQSPGRPMHSCCLDPERPRSDVQHCG